MIALQLLERQVEAARVENIRLRQVIFGIGSEAQNALAGIRGYHSAMLSIVRQVEGAL